MDNVYNKIYNQIIDRNNRELGYKTIIKSHNDLYNENLNLEKEMKEMRIKLLRYEESYDTNIESTPFLKDDYF